jgi:hypothetical protein
MEGYFVSAESSLAGNTQRTPQDEKREDWRDIDCCQGSGGR